eukprot:scaffold120_cov134-Skeletonema_dohrnii-CCMP3373.AAC.5
MFDQLNYPIDVDGSGTEHVFKASIATQTRRQMSLSLILPTDFRGIRDPNSRYQDCRVGGYNKEARRESDFQNRRRREDLAIYCIPKAKEKRPHHTATAYSTPPPATNSEDTTTEEGETDKSDNSSERDYEDIIIIIRPTLHRNESPKHPILDNAEKIAKIVQSFPNVFFHDESFNTMKVQATCLRKMLCSRLSLFQQKSDKSSSHHWTLTLHTLRLNIDIISQVLALLAQVSSNIEAAKRAEHFLI